MFMPHIFEKSDKIEWDFFSKLRILPKIQNDIINELTPLHRPLSPLGDDVMY